MRVQTAKYSSVSSSQLDIFEQDNLLMITHDPANIDLFRNYYEQFADSTSITEILKKVYHQTKDPNFDLVVAATLDDKVYFLCSNGSGVFVYRGEKLVPLIKTTKGDMSTASGVMQRGDMYLLATHNFFENAALDDINSFLQEQKNSETSESLNNLIKSHPEILVVILKTKQFVSEITHTEQVNPGLAIETNPSSKGFIVRNIDKLLNKISRRSIVVSSDEVQMSRGRKSATLIGIVLLIILGVSIYFGRQADSERRRKAEYEPQLEQAEYNLSEAIDIAGLSPARAQELLLSSRQIAFDLKNSGIEDQRLEYLLNNIQQNLGPIAGIYETDPELFLDLTLINSTFSGDDIAYAGNTIRVLDKEQKRLVGVDIESKRTDIISGPEFFPDVLQTFAYEDRSFILSSDGIREVTGDVELLIRSDWDADNILAYAFAGNVYLVNKQTGEILRHQGVRGGFLESENWLGEGVEMDFSNAVSMTIDGDIWVLESDGNIDRLQSGVPRSFSLSGERINIDVPTTIYTEDEGEYLYILDKGKSRIAIFSKDGLYIGEYTNDKLSNAIDLIVSEENRKAIFLSESKLYSIELSHLK